MKLATLFLLCFVSLDVEYGTVLGETRVSKVENFKEAVRIGRRYIVTDYNLPDGREKNEKDDKCAYFIFEEKQDGQILLDTMLHDNGWWKVGQSKVNFSTPEEMMLSDAKRHGRFERLETTDKGYQLLFSNQTCAIVQVPNNMFPEYTAKIYEENGADPTYCLLVSYGESGREGRENCLNMYSGSCHLKTFKTVNTAACFPPYTQLSDPFEE